MKEATVILGGGAALGFAHIGVLKVIARHFQIKRIIGTSMGAIVGGFYSAGMSPDQILEFGKDFRYTDFINPLNIDLKFQGVFDGSFIEKRFNEKIADAVIENLPISYSAVAFDVNSKNTVIMDSGNCAKAMRASASIPYIFNPVLIGDYQLVDGGVEYPLPCLDLDNDEYTIAVNVLPKIANKTFHFNMDSFSENKKKAGKKWYEIVMEAINCNQSFLVQERLKNFTPDLYIDCDIKSFSPGEFLKITEIAQLGEQVAENALKQL